MSIKFLIKKRKAEGLSEAETDALIDKLKVFIRDKENPSGQKFAAMIQLACVTGERIQKQLTA